jgi:acyl carrier protein
MPTVATPKEIEQKLMDALAEFGPDPDEISRDATLADLEIDSLDLVELAQIAEENWGVQLQPEDMKDVQTVGDALDAVIAKVP